MPGFPCFLQLVDIFYPFLPGATRTRRPRGPRHAGFARSPARSKAPAGRAAERRVERAPAIRSYRKVSLDGASIAVDLVDGGSRWLRPALAQQDESHAEALRSI